VVVVVGVAAALSVAVVLQLAPPRFRHEFQPRCPMQHALEKYSVGFLNVAPIPANHRLIFSTAPLKVRTTSPAFEHGSFAIK
jgi:hypothetical protein